MTNAHPRIHRQSLQGRQVHRRLGGIARGRVGSRRSRCIGLGRREQTIHIEGIGVQGHRDLRRLEAVDTGLQGHLRLVQQGRQISRSSFLLQIGRHLTAQLQRRGRFRHRRILDVDLAIQRRELVATGSQAGLHRRGQLGRHGTSVLRQLRIQPQAVDLQIISGATDTGQRQHCRQPFLVPQAHLGLDRVTRSLVAGNGQLRRRHRTTEAVSPHPALGIQRQVVQINDRALRIKRKALELEGKLLDLQRVDGALETGAEVTQPIPPLLQVDLELALHVEVATRLGRGGTKAQRQRDRRLDDIGQRSGLDVESLQRVGLAGLAIIEDHARVGQRHPVHVEGGDLGGSLRLGRLLLGGRILGAQQVVDAHAAISLAHHLGLQAIDGDRVGLDIAFQQRQQRHADLCRRQAGSLLLGLIGLGQPHLRQRDPNMGKDRQLQVALEREGAVVARCHEVGNLRLEVIDIDKTDRDGGHDQQAHQHADDDRQLLDHDWTPISEFRCAASEATSASTCTGGRPGSCSARSRRRSVSSPGSTGPKNRGWPFTVTSNVGKVSMSRSPSSSSSSSTSTQAKAVPAWRGASSASMVR